MGALQFDRTPLLQDVSRLIRQLIGKLDVLALQAASGRLIWIKLLQGEGARASPLNVDLSGRLIESMLQPIDIECLLAERMISSERNAC